MLTVKTQIRLCGFLDWSDFPRHKAQFLVCVFFSRICSNMLSFQLLYTKVDSVEKRLIGSGGTITIKCKDFMLIYLDVPTAEDCLNVATSIEQLSNIGRYLIELCHQKNCLQDYRPGLTQTRLYSHRRLLEA